MAVGVVLAVNALKIQQRHCHGILCFHVFKKWKVENVSRYVAHLIQIKVSESLSVTYLNYVLCVSSANQITAF